MIGRNLNVTSPGISRTDRKNIYDHELNRKLKFSVKEIHRESKKMDEFGYAKHVDGNSFITNRKESEKSK